MVGARWAAVAAATACLAFAAPAHAQTTIDSPDMEIDVGTAGDLGAFFNTDGYGQVLPDGAGLQVVIAGKAIAPGDFTPVSQSAVTGTGTGTDPFTVETKFQATIDAADVLDVTQDVTHVSGDPRVHVQLALANPTKARETVRPFVWGDVTGGGFAEGTGALLGTAPRYLAGVFPTTGSVSGLEEITPWAHYEEAGAAALTTQLTDPSTALNDTVSAAAPHDTAVAAQFPDLTLTAGESRTLDVVWRFVPGAAHLDLEPGDGSGPPGQLACFTATVTDIYGAPLAGIPVDFDAGDPHPALTAPTDAGGHAAYCVSAAEPDEEVFVDAEVSDALLDGFASWEFTGPSSEPGGSGDENAPPTPVAGSRLTARVVSGKVRLRHGTRYTTLTGPTAIKVGSTLDARHGTVELTALVKGHKQTGRFGAGIFRVHQASASAPVALALAGKAFGPTCKRPGSHKVVRRLRASTARGRWRTVARRSTGSVKRAATWITQDRCDGTLTVVHKGAATVRGAHGHAVAVRAGHRRLVPRHAAKRG